MHSFSQHLFLFLVYGCNIFLWTLAHLPQGQRVGVTIIAGDPHTSLGISHQTIGPLFLIFLFFFSPGPSAVKVVSIQFHMQTFRQSHTYIFSSIIALLIPEVNNYSLQTWSPLRVLWNNWLQARLQYLYSIPSVATLPSVFILRNSLEQLDDNFFLLTWCQKTLSSPNTHTIFFLFYYLDWVLGRQRNKHICPTTTLNGKLKKTKTCYLKRYYPVLVTVGRSRPSDTLLMNCKLAQNLQSGLALCNKNPLTQQFSFWEFIPNQTCAKQFQYKDDHYSIFKECKIRN